MNPRHHGTFAGKREGFKSLLTANVGPPFPTPKIHQILPLCTCALGNLGTRPQNLKYSKSTVRKNAQKIDIVNSGEAGVGGPNLVAIFPAIHKAALSAVVFLAMRLLRGCGRKEETSQSSTHGHPWHRAWAVLNVSECCWASERRAIGE